MTASIKLRMRFADWSRAVDEGEMASRRSSARLVAALVTQQMASMAADLALMDGDMLFFGTAAYKTTPSGFERIAPEDMLYGNNRPQEPPK